MCGGAGGGREAAAMEVFRELVFRRYAARSFDPEQSVSEETVRGLMELVVRAPTSFNAQPWRAVVVQEEDAREELSGAMLGPNAQLVRQAPVSVVFAADLQPLKRLDALIELERTKGGKPEGYLSMLTAQLKLFTGGADKNRVKTAAMHLLSAAQPLPVPHSTTEAWSFKQTIFAAQTLLLGATAAGLDTAAMEGFDATRVKNALRIPLKRYSVAVVIAMGYHGDNPLDNIETRSPSARFPFEDMISFDQYDFADDAVHYEDEG